MSEKKYFCFCSSNCKYETMTKEQILAAIAQAAETGLVIDPDSGFITRVKETNAGGYISFWVGTQAQYNALAVKDRQNCMYIITDSASAAELTQAVKALEEHVTNKENPHGVTAAQVGAAPASGFESSYSVGSVEELNTLIDNITKSQEIGTRKTYYIVLRWHSDATLPTGRWCVTIHKPDVGNEATWAGVTATIIASQKIIKLQREMYSGTWQAWEWVNPPMEVGKTYRTTERFNNEVVYTTLIDCEAMPNNAHKSIEHGIGMNKVVRWCGYAGTMALPVNAYSWQTGTQETITIDVTISTTAVYIKSNYDASKYSGMVQVWFTRG